MERLVRDFIRCHLRYINLIGLEYVSYSCSNDSRDLRRSKDSGYGIVGGAMHEIGTRKILPLDRSDTENRLFD